MYGCVSVLLQILRSHSIESMPGEGWQMRFGVHTGSIVAGVVGKTLPRYCLFGDTINIAKSLQRSSQRNRLFVSSLRPVLSTNHNTFSHANTD
jgi:class 3 adenylate cyclase